MYFSIVIPLYNKEKHIKRSVMSVLNQNYQKFEVLVVDDGSTDDSYKKVKEIKDSRIRVIRQKNKGVSAARNKGINEAKYDYVCFLDADDVWKENFLSSIIILIEKYPRAKAYATAFESVGYDKADKKIKVKSLSNSPNIQSNESGIIDDYFKHSLNRVFMWTSATVIDKSIIESIGNFPVQIKMGEDLFMWLKIALNYDIAFYNKPCAIYYKDSDNRVSNKKYKANEVMSTYAEDLLITIRKDKEKSIFLDEYLLDWLMTDARNLIIEGEKGKARKILRKHRKEIKNRRRLLKIYSLLFLPKNTYFIYNKIKKKLYSWRNFIRGSKHF